LAIRFVKGQFSEYQESTVGAAYFTKAESIDCKSIEAELWDTAGQERYASLGPMYYRDATCAMIVYAVTSAESFQRAKQWVKEVQQKGSPDVFILIVGNKIDLESEREVARADALQYAQDNGAQFIETSAKNNVNVREAFLKCMQHVSDSYPQSKPETLDLSQVKLRMDELTLSLKHHKQIPHLSEITEIEDHDDMSMVLMRALDGLQNEMANTLQALSSENADLKRTNAKMEAMQRFKTEANERFKTEIQRELAAMHQQIDEETDTKEETEMEEAYWVKMDVIGDDFNEEERTVDIHIAVDKIAKVVVSGVAAIASQGVLSPNLVSSLKGLVVNASWKQMDSEKETVKHMHDGDVYMFMQFNQNVNTTSKGCMCCKTEYTSARGQIKVLYMEAGNDAARAQLNLMKRKRAQDAFAFINGMPGWN